MLTTEEFMNPKPTLLRRGLLAATVACAALSVAAAPAHAAFSITETDADSFRYSTAPDWTSLGGIAPPPSGPAGNWTPYLTAGTNPGDDPEGDGWLRLSNESDLWQRGMAVYNTAFSSTEGMQITFDYASYGGTGADGITFFLLDGNAPLTLGGSGGGLGYAWSATGSGVTGGYVGIGLDEYNCIVAPSLPPTPPCPPNNHNQQMVAVWGASDPATRFPYLATQPMSIAPAGRPGRSVRITLSPATPKPTLTVEIDSTGTGFVKVIDMLPLTGNGPVPSMLKLGFSASTGGENNIHEVRIRSAKTLVSAVPTVGQSTPGALAAMLALLTLPALRRCVRN
jgi:hypothetical protein